MNIKNLLILKGSERIGNYGHVGNSPKRGGSSKGGGFDMISTSRGLDTHSLKVIAKKKKNPYDYS